MPERSNRFLARVGALIDLPRPNDSFGRRILAEYGAVLVTSATPPPGIAFGSAAEVDAFQRRAGRAQAEIGGIPVTLQRPALDALLDAAREAERLGASVTPRGTDASARSWGDSEALWLGRVERACAHWIERGRLAADEACALLSGTHREQAARVLDLERDGIFFSTFFDKTILQSVAAPGTSQHLSMLAFDVAEFADPVVRRLLPRFGWHQTVVSDLPHFTFLGHAESELSRLGLGRVEATVDDQEYGFWVPDLG